MSFLSVVLVGNDHCGKSTLGGRMVLNGYVPQKIRGVPLCDLKEGKAYDSYGLELSWVCDQRWDERRERKSKDFSVTYFRTRKRTYSLIDTPTCNGHYTVTYRTKKNRHLKGSKDPLFKGVSLGDIAILVGDVNIRLHNPARSFVQLLAPYVFGIKTIIFALSNHVDNNLGTSSERDFQRLFCEMMSECNRACRRVGFSPQQIYCVPFDAVHDENISSRSPKYEDWWPNTHYNGSGQCLFEILDGIDEQTTLIHQEEFLTQPFRLYICRIYDNIQGNKFVFAGRIESGRISIGKEVFFPCSKVSAHIQRIDFMGKQVKSAQAGQIITFSLLQNNGLLFDKDDHPFPKSGDVVSLIPSNHHFHPVQSCIVSVMTLYPPLQQLKIGYCPVLRHRTSKCTVRIDEILNVYDRRTGKLINTNPSYVRKRYKVDLRLSFKTRDIVLDEYRTNKKGEKFPFKGLTGRIILTDNDYIVAGGIVKKIESTKKVKIKPMGDTVLDEEVDRIHYLFSSSSKEEEQQQLMLTVAFQNKEKGENIYYYKSLFFL